MNALNQFSNVRKRSFSTDSSDYELPSKFHKTSHSRSGVESPVIGVAIPSFIHAPSCFIGVSDEKNITVSEKAALEHLLPNPGLALEGLENDEDCFEINLSDFDVYHLPSGRHHGTLAMLYELDHPQGAQRLCFDGTLHKDGLEQRVQGVVFNLLSIEGYGRDAMTQPAAIYLQSVRNKGSEVWYRLQTPSSSYRSFYEPFKWVTEFCVLFVGFLEDKMANRQNVFLNDFRDQFYHWLVRQPVDPQIFDPWLEAFGKTDFRQHVVAQTEFLWKEATNILPRARNLALWKEFDLRSLGAIREQPVRENLTTVTPFTLRCFKDSYFADFLKQVTMSDAATEAWVRKARGLGLSCVTREDLDAAVRHPRQEITTDGGGIREGDIVVVDGDSDTQWNTDDNGWLAYVQAVKEDRTGPYLSLIWLYKPEDTICAPGFYPFSWELFMSDHCNCGDPKVRPSDVRRKTKAKFYAKDIECLDEHFVRQTYITPDEEGGKDASFVSLDKSHFKCWHLDDKERDALHDLSQKHPPCSTVLVRWQNHEYLEPAVVEEYLDNSLVRVRHLCRRKEYDADAADNELLDTTQKLNIPRKSIERECIIRRFSESAVRRCEIPAPYSYDGTGDAWCLTGSLSDDGYSREVLPLDASMPPSFEEGFDPHSEVSTRKLKCLSLFSGGGSFDRGLEEGGAVESKWAVEMAKVPIHTYRANLRDPQDVKLYFGSVNDYMQDAIRGVPSDIVAKIDEVAALIAGSPCQGFSLATQDRQSDKAKREASLVASVMSYINLYCPAYAILENVVAMSHNVKGEKLENVFSQVVSVLVAMGYQIAIVNCDAWSMGSPQSRSRLFLLASAPGLEPMSVPPQTHTHPPTTWARGLGKTQCGVRFGLRTPVDSICPFPFMSAAKAARDLPDIGDGRMRACVAFPDHRVIQKPVASFTKTIQAVPRFPFKQSLASARARGLVGKAVLDLYKRRPGEWHGENSKAFRRIHPGHLFPTIKTKCRIDCARMGTCVHWDEPRGLSLLEARRAQSIPDHEVLVGGLNDQIHVVGNGVDRKVSVSLGMSLRRAWLAPKTQARLGGIVPQDTVMASKSQWTHSPFDVDRTRHDTNGASFTKLADKHVHAANVIPIEESDVSSTTDSEMNEIFFGVVLEKNGPSMPTKAWRSPQTPLEDQDGLESESDEVKSVILIE